MHSVRKPALRFREAAALDALQQGSALTSRELGRKIGLGRNIADETCAVLAAHGLIACSRRIWGQGKALEWSPTPLAQRLFPPRTRSSS